jgi:hypothetical protein
VRSWSTDALQVIEVPFRDGDGDGLHRREPWREGARVVLGQHADEAFDRAEQRAVDHHRSLSRPVGGCVLEAEALRQVEVELDGRHLPGAPDGVACLDRDLRP